MLGRFAGLWNNNHTMPKGVLISKADVTKYEVEFTVTTFANLKKEPVTGTVAAGSHA